MAQENTQAISRTIASGASLSSAIQVSGFLVVGLVMPAAWTAASITFSVSSDGSTYNDMYSEGAEYSLTVDASQFHELNPRLFAGAQYLKIRSGTSGTPVNQGADRVVQLIVRPA